MGVDKWCRLPEVIAVALLFCRATQALIKLPGGAPSLPPLDINMGPLTNLGPPAAAPLDCIRPADPRGMKQFTNPKEKSLGPSCNETSTSFTANVDASELEAKSTSSALCSIKGRGVGNRQFVFFFFFFLLSSSPF